MTEDDLAKLGTIALYSKDGGLHNAARIVQEAVDLIGRLPKTADGVVVVPDMEVWLPGYKYPGYVEYLMGDDLVAVNDMNEWTAKDCDTIRGYTVRHPASLYSTPEAAEAARKEAQ
jgi:hypothetical protein